MEQLGSHWTDFHEMRYLSIFRKSVQEIQVSLKYDKNNGYLTWRPMYICNKYLAQFFSGWEIFQTNVVEKIKTRILCSITFFFRKSCRVWNNVEKYGIARQATDDNIIRRMRFACWITKATDTHSEYVIFIAFSRQQWLRERASMLHYTYIACLVIVKPGGKYTDQQALKGCVGSVILLTVTSQILYLIIWNVFGSYTVPQLHCLKYIASLILFIILAALTVCPGGCRLTIG
jgi:hypothetical protein